MATIDTIVDRSTGSAVAGKAYFETSTNKFIIYNGSSWVEIDSDGTGSAFINAYSADFDGTNDYLELSAAPSSDFNFGTGEFGLSMWVNAVTGFNGAYCGVLGSYNNSSSSWQVFVGSAGLHIWNGAMYGGGSLSTNTWYHLVVERTSGVLKTYINGVQNSSNSVSTSYSPATNSSTCIGGYPVNRAQPRWKGLIDEVAIFNSGLSAPDVTAMYNGTAPNGKPTALTKAASYDTDRTSNLVGYWRMGDDSNDTATAGGSISTITDSSGNGNDATQSDVTKQPTFADLTGETIYA